MFLWKFLDNLALIIGSDIADAFVMLFLQCYFNFSLIKIDRVKKAIKSPFLEVFYLFAAAESSSISFTDKPIDGFKNAVPVLSVL